MRKPPPTVRAGDRPMRRGGSSGEGRSARTARVGKAVAAVLSVLALLGLAGPWRSAVVHPFSTAYRAARRTVAPTYAAVRPIMATATSALKGQEAPATIDGVANQAWAEDSPGDGVGQELTFTFAAPVDLAKVGIIAGASSDQATFLTQPRPGSIRLVFSDGSMHDLVLKDEAGFQTFSLKAKKVSEVKLQILLVYPSAQGGHNGSIAEVEFFTRR